MRRQIWQRVTGRWVTVTGNRRECVLLICFHDAIPFAVPRHLAALCARASDMRWAGWLPGGGPGLLPGIDKRERYGRQCFAGGVMPRDGLVAEDRR